MPIFEGHCEALIDLSCVKISLSNHLLADVFKQQNITVNKNIPQDLEKVWEQFHSREATVDVPDLLQFERIFFYPWLYKMSVELWSTLQPIVNNRESDNK